MVDKIYEDIKRLEMEGKNTIARKSSLECSIKSFKFLNNNINKLKSEYVLSILGIINNYLLGLKFSKKKMDYELLEEEASVEYNKLIRNDTFLKIKKMYINEYQDVKEELFWNLENKFIELVKYKNTERDKLVLKFERFYGDFLNLISVMTLDVKHMYFIKNVLLYMKYHNIDNIQLISNSKVKKMLIEYDKIIKRK